MPIEIRELIIKASIDGVSKNGTASANSSNSNQNQAALINICIEKVMEKLKEKMER